MIENSTALQIRPSRFIGIDWADREHEVHTVDSLGNGRSQTIAQTPEAIEEWINDELSQAGGPIAIILEQSCHCAVKTGHACAG